MYILSHKILLLYIRHQTDTEPNGGNPLGFRLRGNPKQGRQRGKCALGDLLGSHVLYILFPDIYSIISFISKNHSQTFKPYVILRGLLGYAVIGVFVLHHSIIT